MNVSVSEECGIPPERRTIRLFPDYMRDWPLWENSTPTWDVGYTTTPQMYGLSEELTEAIRSWNDFWEKHFAAHIRWDSDDHRDWWAEEGESIARRMRTEVYYFADVSYEASAYL